MIRALNIGTMSPMKISISVALIILLAVIVLPSSTQMKPNIAPGEGLRLISFHAETNCRPDKSLVQHGMPAMPKDGPEGLTQWAVIIDELLSVGGYSKKSICKEPLRNEWYKWYGMPPATEEVSRSSDIRAAFICKNCPE